MGWFKHDVEAEGFTAAGRGVLCAHCGGALFLKSEAQLHTQGLTFFQLEWLGRSVHVLICADCGAIAWFAREPEKAAGG